jgi:hypothetical protein
LFRACVNALPQPITRPGSSYEVYSSFYSVK